MKKWVSTKKTLIAGVIIGSLLGFLHWYFVGCSSGSCMITSKPLNSTLYGALVGGVLGSVIFEKEKQKKHDI